MSERGPTRPLHQQLLAVSWNFGWPIAAGVVLGHWLDERLGSSPAATLLFAIGALGAAVSRLLTLSKRDAVERHALEHGDAPKDRQP